MKVNLEYEFYLKRVLGHCLDYLVDMDSSILHQDWIKAENGIDY